MAIHPLCTEFHRNGSKDTAFVRDEEPLQFEERHLLCPMDGMDNTHEVEDTFYSEAGTLDLFDIALSPKVHICY